MTRFFTWFLRIGFFAAQIWLLVYVIQQHAELNPVANGAFDCIKYQNDVSGHVWHDLDKSLSGCIFLGMLSTLLAIMVSKFGSIKLRDAFIIGGVDIFCVSVYWMMCAWTNIQFYLPYARKESAEQETTGFIFLWFIFSIVFIATVCWLVSFTRQKIDRNKEEREANARHNAYMRTQDLVKAKAFLSKWRHEQNSLKKF